MTLASGMSRRALPVAWFWGECGEGTTQTCLARLKPKFSESESTYECYCNVLLWTLCWCSVGSQQAIMESPVVCLNVAGCYFTTARETILREPASKLALQLRGVLPTLKDDAGHGQRPAVLPSHSELPARWLDLAAAHCIRASRANAGSQILSSKVPVWFATWTDQCKHFIEHLFWQKSERTILYF